MSLSQAIESAIDSAIARNPQLGDLPDSAVLMPASDPFGYRLKLEKMVENEFILADGRYSTGRLSCGLEKPVKDTVSVAKVKPVEKRATQQGGGDKGDLLSATPSMVNKRIAQMEAIVALGLGEDSPSMFD